jgi:hypothetical protein
LTISYNKERHFKDTKQACKKRLSKEEQAKGKAKGKTKRRTSKASKLLIRYKVSKSKVIANLVLLKAREALL